jgi:nucleotide-binding universal stress UspA family protein
MTENQTPLIIAAIDSSDILEPVVTRADKLARCMNATLVIMHIVKEKSANLSNASYGDMVLGNIDDEDIKIEDDMRNKLAIRIDALGVNSSLLEIVAGSSVGKTVQDELEKRNADLLIVGQPKAMLGSVATNMAKHAACDVYIVRVK